MKNIDGHIYTPKNIILFIIILFINFLFYYENTDMVCLAIQLNKRRPWQNSSAGLRIICTACLLSFSLALLLSAQTQCPGIFSRDSSLPEDRRDLIQLCFSLLDSLLSLLQQVFYLQTHPHTVP